MADMESGSQSNEKEEKNLQRVLVADDDPPTRMLLHAAITQWGYDVVEAGDGEEAWQILQQADAPRILILDWLMPKLDGLTLCSRIRKELEFNHYIILLTQVAGTTNLIKGLEAGADEFLSKPFNMAELCSRLAVGARIVKFENMLAAQNRQTHTYISQLIKISAMLLSISRNIDEILKTDASLEEAKKSTALLQEIHQLRSGLERISEVIRKFQSTVKA